MYFQNRQHAGQLLAEKLASVKIDHPLLLALPRGGVPIAVEIAKSLHCPLEILAVRKIGSPYNSELAVGAICEGCAPIYNDYILSQLGLTPDDMKKTVEREREEMDRQINKFRAGSPLPSVKKKTVIVVDDGLATGATMSAAIQCLEKKGSGRIIVAVPVAASMVAQSLRKKVSEVVVVEERKDLWSVSQWYGDFTQISDETVKELLEESRHSAFAQKQPVVNHAGEGSSQMGSMTNR